MATSRVDLIKNAKSYIGKRGYIIRKKYLKENEIKEIKNDMTVKPFVNGDYGAQEESFKIYLENDSKLYLPKFYGIKRFGNADVNILPDGKDIDIKFELNLKEEQRIPAEKTLEAYHKDGGGILSLPCGFGKTILALYFIAQLRKKTLVIVHKEFLMNQWIERINFALPGAKVGVIQGNKCEIDGNDIIIGMLQTLSMREFPDDTFDDIGHVIIDEAHHISSKVFSKALIKINCKYMLAISATVNRKDGLTKVLKYYVGDVIYSIKSNEKNITKVERYLLESEDEYYTNEVINFRGQVQMATMINNITNSRSRTSFIVKKIIENIGENSKRQFIILSDRRQHLEDIYNLIKNTTEISVGYYVGGMKQNKLKENENCTVILATYQIAAEGLDIPTLNGLILASPRSDIVQAVGRIDRIIHKDIQPLIIDMCDQFSVFESQCKKRFALFKKKKYQITDINYNLDKGVERMRKDYHFHSCSLKNSDSSDEDTELDTDISNDNKVKSKGKSKCKDNLFDEKKEVENLFKSFSFFS
jgi:superfamily II DNA or RNA helicase